MVFQHIRGLREDRDWSQRYVAHILGVSQNTYSQYETGRIPWTDKTLLTLADLYGVSVDYLMDRTDKM